MKLPELGVQKPVTTLMFFLAVLVLGAVMATQLSQNRRRSLSSGPIDHQRCGCRCRFSQSQTSVLLP